MVFDVINRYSGKENVPLRLSIVSFFIAFGFAAFESIWGLFLFGIYNNESHVGFVSGFLSIAGFLGYIFFVPIIQKYEEKLIWIIAAFGFIASYLLFYFIESPFWIIVIAILYYLFRVLNDLTRGLMLSNSCQKSDMGKTLGMNMAIRGIGYLLAPLLAGYIVVQSEIRSVFIIAPLFVLIALVLMYYIPIKDIRNTNALQLKDCIKNIKLFFKDKDARTVFFLSGGIPFYWSTYYIYVPIYMKLNGYLENHIGIFLFLFVIPVIIAEYPSGRLADKIGYKRLFRVGYFIMFLFSLLAFIFSYNVILSLSMLFLGSIGVGIIDSNRESFLFKSIHTKDRERFYGPFRTHREIFRILPKILCGIMFGILSMTSIGSGRIEYVFLLVSISMFIYYIMSLNLIHGTK